MKALSAFLVALLWPAAGAAQVSELYARSTLQQLRPQFQYNTNRIVNELIWPSLLSEEKHRLGDRPPLLDFPLLAEPPAQDHPLAFYVSSARRIIVLPVLSLKFLDDLCTAYAWLQLNGYGFDTIAEYTALLLYASPPRDGFPAPLPALGIPEDARANPQVDSLARDLSVNARTFIVLHEMGHLMYAKHAGSFEESLRNEEEADQVAVQAMRRMGLFPSGMLIYFEADAHWSNYPPTGRDIHPLSGERVRALADTVDEPEAQAMLRRAGALLDDPAVRRSFVEMAKAGDFSALAPRRPGELPRRAQPSSASQGSAAFDGTFRGELVESPGARSLPMEFTLKRNGQGVRGDFSFGVGFGKLEGYLEGNILYFDWEWANRSGRGVLESQGADEFSGTWGLGEARAGAGRWTGHRPAQPGSAPPG